MSLSRETLTVSEPSTISKLIMSACSTTNLIFFRELLLRPFLELSSENIQEADVVVAGLICRIHPGCVSESYVGLKFLLAAIL